MRKNRAIFTDKILVALLPLFFSPLFFSDTFADTLNPDEKEGLLPSREIRLFLKGKVSFLDNYSSKLLLFVADRLFEQEFTESKRVASTGRSRDGAGYPISFKRTIGFLDEVIAKRGDDRFMDRFLYLRGYCSLEQGLFDKAYEDFARIGEEYPESELGPEVNFRIAEYYFTTEQMGLAIETYKKVLADKDSPYYDKAIYKLGWAYYLTSNFDEAIDYFIQLADLSYGVKEKGVYPEKEVGAELGSEDLSNEALLYAAISFTNTGGAREVLMTLGKSLKPYSRTLYSEVAQAYFDQSKYSDFVKVCNKFITLFKKAPVVLKMQKEVIAIQELGLSDKEGALKRKELFVEEYYPYMLLREERRLREKLDRHLRPVIRELSSFFHQESRKNGQQELLKKAAGYYEKYLKLYKDAKGAKLINFYYAESLYELGDYIRSASEFEKIAPLDFGDLKINEKALYGAVSSYENILRALPEKSPRGERERVALKLIEAEKQYTRIFPLGEKSGPLFFRQGKRLFDKRDYSGAVEFFTRARTALSDEKEKNAASEYMADSYFNNREFNKALKEYENLLKVALETGDSTSAAKARSYIFRVHVNIAEEFIKKGKIAQGAKRYERAAGAFPTPDDRRRVLGKAMRLYISIRGWDEFERVYSEFSSLFPDRLQKTLLHAAKVARENFDSLASARFFERASSLDSDLKKKHKILIMAAMQYEKGEDIKNARRIFSALYKSNTITEAQQLEFRYKAAELQERSGDRRGAERLYSEIVTLHRAYMDSPSSSEKGNKYFFGKASLRLLEKPIKEFISIKLTPPFAESFEVKLTRMGELVQRLMEIARLDITEFSTRSLYQIGALFENFRKSLVESPPPEGLNEEEEEEYRFMLEEKAFPYEERSVKTYEKSVAIGRKKGITDRYIDLSFERLAEISPAIYKREEDIFLSEVIPLDLPFNFIGKIDMDQFNREKDEAPE